MLLVTACLPKYHPSLTRFMSTSTSPFYTSAPVMHMPVRHLRNEACLKCQQIIILALVMSVQGDEAVLLGVYCPSALFTAVTTLQFVKHSRQHRPCDPP